MSKIGVITFSNAVDNYGQVLQYLATQEFLQAQGHDVALLMLVGGRLTCWRRGLKFVRRCINWGLRRIKRCLKWTSRSVDLESVTKDAIFRRWSEVSALREASHTRHFAEFKNKYFRTFRGSCEEVREHGFSVVCAGSDQIWAWADSHSLLAWAPEGCIKISIASSVGHWDFSQANLSRHKRWLRDFLFLTVREDNGLEFCRRCGRDDAIKVLDPTFLLTAEDYRRFSDIKSHDKPYVLVYLLGGEIERSVSEILDFIRLKGYDVRYVESQGREEPYDSVNATVEEWLGLVSGAEYVITNSFHGMAFSIIFQRPFLVFPLVGVMASMNGRIEDLAKQTNLQNRIYSGSLEKLFDEVDWREAVCRIEANRSSLAQLVKTI